MTDSEIRVLVVDDERELRRGAAAYLSKIGGMEVFVAPDGAEAIELLDGHEVDIVVTDLRMPVVDGFELLAHLSESHPSVPVIVMTAYRETASQDQLKQLGDVTCLEKPFPMESLVAQVEQLVSERAKGFLKGISVASILQLLELEQKTTTVTLVRDAETEGQMTFVHGRLVDARAGDLRGDDAAMKIIAWEEARVRLEGAQPNVQETVTSGLHYLMMESLRRKDEGSLPLESTDFKDSNPPVSQDKSQARRMTLEGIIDRLSDVDGLLGLALVSLRGELLAAMPGTDIDFETGAQGAAKMATAALSVTETLNLDGCSEVMVGTKDGLLIVQRPPMGDRVPFLFVAVVSWSCDQPALAERLAEVLPDVIDVFW